jgi:hypothetical protein
MFAFAPVVLLKTHGVALDELTCNVLFIVICVGDTSIGISDFALMFAFSIAL